MRSTLARKLAEAGTAAAYSASPERCKSLKFSRRRRRTRPLQRLLPK